MSGQAQRFRITLDVDVYDARMIREPFAIKDAFTEFLEVGEGSSIGLLAKSNIERLGPVSGFANSGGGE